MKLATWNVNSLNVRLPQVLDWLAANPVDALCLQELKLTDDKFPEAAFTEAGYHAVWAGQKTYNGVAILSRAPGAGMVRNIPGFEDPQQRVLALTLPSPDGDVRVVCAYCPNGQSVGSDKYEYKLAWFEGMRKWLADEIGQYRAWPCWATTTSRRPTRTCTTRKSGKARCWCPNPSATPSAPCSTWA